jgi:predicted HicB family RNase H-like nuclease
MTSLTLELPTELVEQLQQATQRAGQPLNTLVAQFLAGKVSVSHRQAPEQAGARDARG